MGDVLNRGTKSKPLWYCRLSDESGVRRQKATRQPTKEGAKKFLAAVEARIRSGQVGIVERTSEDRQKQTISVGELARHFLGEVDGMAGYAPPRIKSIKNYRGDARSVFTVHVFPALGRRPAASVTLRDVEDLRDRLLAKKKASATVVHALAVLSKLYNWSRRTGLIECGNPVIGVERPRTVSSLDYLDRSEIGPLLATAEQQANASTATSMDRVRYPMVATAVYCGLRKGELFGLRWCDLALDAGRCDVNRSYDLLPKSGKPRSVPIHPELLRILRLWRAQCPATQEGLLFPVEAELGRFRMGIERDMLDISVLLATAGCHAPADGKPWHLLRHSFASHFIMSRGSLFTLQRLLGHASPSMTQRYAHLAPGFLAGEVARMTFAIAIPGDISNLADARNRAGA